MKAIKYLLAALLVISITKRTQPNDIPEPQADGHLDAFNYESEQSDQQDFISNTTQQTFNLHNSVSQIPKTTLQDILPNYKGADSPSIANSGLINMKSLEEKLSDKNPSSLVEPKTSVTNDEAELITPESTESEQDTPKQDALEQENLESTLNEITKEEKPQMAGMSINQIISSTLDHIIPEHQTLSNHLISQIHNALHQKSMTEPEESQFASTNKEEQEQIPRMPLRHLIANTVNSILPDATEESVSNIVHPGLVDYALNNPKPEDQLTSTDDPITEQEQISGMPLRHLIANTVNSILPDATEESVSNIVHPGLVDYVLNNPKQENSKPKKTIEPAASKNYVAYRSPEDMTKMPSRYDFINNQPQQIVNHHIPSQIHHGYANAMKLGTMDNSTIPTIENSPSTQTPNEEDGPIFSIDSLKQGPQPSKNVEYYDQNAKTLQIKNGPLFVGVMEFNKITETLPGSEIRSLKKIPATIPTPHYDLLQHGFHRGIKPRTALYGLCVERCNPYSSTLEPSYPIKAIDNSSKTIGHYWPNSKIAQYKTGETFVEVVPQKRYHYRTIEKPTLNQIKGWFDQKKLLKQYGISSHDDHYDSLISPDGIGTVEIEKRHKQTLYGVLLKNPYTPEPQTSAELLQNTKRMTHIVHDTLTPGLDEVRAKTERRIEHALNILNLQKQS